MFFGKYILVIFLRLFVIRNFRGTCTSVEMLKGHMARERLITPVVNLNPVPSPRGGFGWLSPPNKTPSPPNWNMKHNFFETWNTNQWCFCPFLECQATPHKRKAFLATVLPKPRRQRQTINESVCCFGWFITWFTGLRGNKWNRTLAER